MNKKKPGSNRRVRALSHLMLAALLACAQSGASAAAQPHRNPHAAARAAGNAPGGQLQCSGAAATPARLHVPLGKSTLVRLPEPVANRTVGNPGVVQTMLVSPQTLYVLAVDIGTTNMIVQGKSGSCAAIDVVVGLDTAGLKASLQELMPEEKNIKVSAAADSLVLSGTVADAEAVARAVDLANAFVHRPASAVPLNTVTPGDADKGKADAGAPAGASQNASAQQQKQGNSMRVINLLSVAAPQQVMLEVKVAEVSKTLLDRLGANANLSTSSGSLGYNILTNFITGTAKGLFGITKSNGNSVEFEAEKREGLVKILAEPNVMAISGQEGSFLAGGKILIPVAQNSLGNGMMITLEEKEFGVGLKFTPTVLAGGRINLRVAPEVSELSRDGVGITATGINGSAILPLITTRRSSTTVQLYDGQSFAISGLIKNNVVSNLNALPVLGELPVLGALFRSADFQRDKTELLFVITPHLVKPMPPDYALPTDNVPDPDRAGFFLGGHMEGPAPAAPASPAAAVPPATQQGPSGFETR